MSILSHQSSSVIILILLHFDQTQAPIGSMLSSVDLTAILLRFHGSLAMAIISTSQSLTSGISFSSNF